MSGAKIESGAAAKEFMLAGNARVTLVSEATGTRFTYQIREGKEETAPHFVSLLNGACNESDYAFLGSIFGKTTYRHGRRSRISPKAGSARAFDWAWKYLAKGELPPSCEVWHEGRCAKCNRTLTTPESIARGIGPECAKTL